MTGLTDSTAYTFTATAKNASSTEPSLPSAASDKAQFVTVSGTPVTAVFGTQTPISLTTTGGSSGAVTFTVTGTGCTVTGTSLKATRAGTCTVTATQGAHKSTAAFPFTAPASHTVTFDSNGAQQNVDNRGNLIGTANATASQTASSTRALTSNPFIYPPLGRVFSGWSTTPTGDREYADKADYEFTADKYLYAVWACKSGPQLSLNAARNSKRSVDANYFIEVEGEVPFKTFTVSTTEGGYSGSKESDFNGRITIGGLNPNKGYDFFVTGTNRAGCSYTSPTNRAGAWGATYAN